MFEEFCPTLGTKVRFDSQGVPRDVIHQEPFRSSAPNPEGAVRDYLGKHHGLIKIRNKELRNLHRAPSPAATSAKIEYRLHAEKLQFNTTTVAYHQTIFGLPIWGAGLAVHVTHPASKRDGFRVVGAQTTRHSKIGIRKLPPARALARLKKIDAQALAGLLGITANNSEVDCKSLRILRRRLMVYRYEKSKRAARAHTGKTRKGAKMALGHPTLPLPPLGRRIVEGRHYVVAALDFRVKSSSFGTLHWVALVEAQTLSVLYLRALVDHVCGFVFEKDPMTLAGGPATRASNRRLNALRCAVTLPGLDPPQAGRRSLSGEHVAILDFEAPQAAPPTEPLGARFAYPARTNHFAAVNAYYNCDRFFRLLEELGFPRARYFKSTKFPVPVDHRGHVDTRDGIEINARTQGNTTAEGGLLNVRFALADTHNQAEPLGLACDWRVVLHELGGHGTLWNHINYGLFKFAHSVGDSLAAILNDPDSRVRDRQRFITFPWVSILNRRHDRKLAQGWAWGGTKDLGVDEQTIDPKGYLSEQILSTTHFRVYRAIGGDAEELNTRRFAARFLAYLILRTVGSLTPVHAPEHAADYAAALMLAERDDWTTERQAGGAYGKVIRWGFEKQGLYQARPSKRPVKKQGAPPLVDVYIEDGRRGEYRYQRQYWNCRAIWNRHAADGGTTHQEPVPGTTNFAYVKIKNRGLTTASGVTVKAFHRKLSAGQIYPADWQPMLTAELAAPDIPPRSAAEITVGPFDWRPFDQHDCVIMVATARSDASNIAHFANDKTIPEWRLVPHDNNIGERATSAVDASGVKSLAAAFDGARIEVKNPHRTRARMVVRPRLPHLLAKRGWQLKFANAGGGAFSLGPGASRDVIMKLKPGKRFTTQQVRRSRDRKICLEVFADGILVGGVTYMLDTARRRRANSSADSRS